MAKYFIITVDTEGDNLWEYNKGEVVGTKNAKYLPIFQTLCEKYGFKPVYLTNYEMAMSDTFVAEAKEWLAKGTCEIGVHLHAWNNPPLYDLSGPYNGNPYLIEYPEEVMRAKFKVIYDLIVERFGVKPISHRAGRWAMDDRYFKILKEFGIKVDCSHTPGINWSTNKGITMGGSDYSQVKLSPYNIDGILEMPVSIVNNRITNRGSFKHKLKVLVNGEKIWLRPATNSTQEICNAIDKIYKLKDVDFVEFMIHSSEVMPSGSPYFKTERDIEQEYSTMTSIFEYANQRGYTGCTIEEYFNLKNND